MNELDKKIKEALRKEDADLFDDFTEEPSMFEMVMEIFRGRHRWLTMYGMILSLVFLVLSIFAAIQFFDAVETRDLIMWAIAFSTCQLFVAMIKIWFWMEMQKNAVTREVKRLELQIARLAGRIKVS